tara:strand:+ start:91 stop:804 length:714 start_codon:yes stop_codon:yes gene_type:complete
MYNKKKLISVVTTAFNESKNIEKSVLEWNKFLIKNKISSEIVVYNDGSTDDTYKKLKTLKKKIKNLKILNGKKNKGYGFGMRKSINKSTGEFLVTIDSDNQYFLSNIKKFLPYIKKGNIFFTGHRVKKKDSFIKIFADLILRQIVRIVFRTKLKDTNCALKMFQAKILKKIRLSSNDYTFPTELCLKIENKGIQIIDLPVAHSHRKDGKSSINLILTSLKFLKFLFLLKLKLLSNDK